MNFQEMSEVLRKLCALEPGFNEPLNKYNKVNVANKIMLAATDHKLHTSEISIAASLIPDLNADICEDSYNRLMASVDCLIKMYNSNKSKIEDVIFLLKWYQRECKNRHGKAS